MAKVFEYKGYIGSIELSLDDSCLYGKIKGINDLVNYEANNLKQLKKEFENAVDDYLQTCKEINKTPEKPFKGSLNVRISPNTHRRLYIASQERNTSINQLIADSIEKCV